MRVIGIDPSSTFCGIAVIDTPDSVLLVDHWKRNKNRSHVQGFKDYFFWLGLKLNHCTPQMAVIEMLSVERNATAAKAVAYYQAISALRCKLNGLVVIEARVTTARKVVLGNGSLSKDQAWGIMRQRHPDLFAPKQAGGMDEMDALVMALAGPDVAERN